MDKANVKVDTSFFWTVGRTFLDPAVIMWTAPVLLNLIASLAPILEVSYWGWVGLVWTAHVIGSILHR
jgi:membrane glycosyltransferase